MTTKVIIGNDATSNGDVILNGVNTTEGRVKDAAIRPGESRELWITTSSMLSITETWPAQPRQFASDGDVIAECGDKGELWAKAYVQVHPNGDVDTLRAWFANAIEAACAKRAAARPTLTIAEVRGAVARGWQADPNRSKEFDSDIAEAASQEIAKLIGVNPETPLQFEPIV